MCAAVSFSFGWKPPASLSMRSFPSCSVMRTVRAPRGTRSVVSSVRAVSSTRFGGSSATRARRSCARSRLAPRQRREVGGLRRAPTRIRISNTGGEASLTKLWMLLRFGSCSADERSQSSKSKLGASQLPTDAWGDRRTMFASTNGVCELPLQGLTLEISLAFPAQHAVCLVHVASRAAI